MLKVSSTHCDACPLPDDTPCQASPGRCSALKRELTLQQGPSWGQMSRGLLEATAQALASGLTLSSAEQRAARWTACQSCPRFHSVGPRCMACGCYLPIKIKLSAWTCPADRW